MPKFSAFQYPSQSTTLISFEQFVNIAKGLSISSAAAASEDGIGPDFLELGLSKAYNLRMQAQGDRLAVSLVSTLNKGEFAPVIVEIISHGETVTAELLEHRLHHLRQVYALVFLVENGQISEVAHLLRQQPLADLERDLIAEGDKLVILEATPGSLYLLLIAKSKKAHRALRYACAVPFSRGREALLGKVEAGTALAQLEVEAKAQDLRLKEANGLIDLAKKLDTIENEDTREIIKNRLFDDMTRLNAVNTPFKNNAISHNPAIPTPMLTNDSSVTRHSARKGRPNKK